MPTTIIWFLNLINSSCPCASAAFAAASIANLLKTDKPVPISARIIFAILRPKNRFAIFTILGIFLRPVYI